MLLAQLTENAVTMASGTLELPPQAAGLLKFLFILIPFFILVGIGNMALWIIALVSAVTREDLKHQKIIWVLVIIFTGTLGGTIYAFVENRKKLGIWSLVMLILSMLMPFVLLSGVGLGFLGK